MFFVIGSRTIQSFSFNEKFMICSEKREKLKKLDNRSQNMTVSCNRYFATN